MNWQSISGWFDWRSAQEEAVAHFPSGSVFVEVGLYLGKSIISLAQLVRESGKDIRVIGVDHCIGSGVELPANATPQDHHAAAMAEGGGTLAGQLHRNLIACGVADLVTVVVADSVRAASLFADGSISFCFLDAGHDYESVKRDLSAWYGKVSPGGWIGGDDLCPVWPGVEQAVKEMLPGYTPWSWDSWRWKKP